MAEFLTRHKKTGSMSQAPTIDFRGRKWAGRLYRHCRYKILYGGRGGGKTLAIAEALIWLASVNRVRIISCRAFKNATNESCAVALKEMVERLGVWGYWNIGREQMTHLVTGSVILFRGLERNKQSIRGWQNVHVVWIEEAHDMDEESWTILRNTVRAENSEIWLSFNPHERTAAAWKLVLQNPPNAYIRRVNYDENPYFPPVLDGERSTCLRDKPESYGHLWLGQPDDGGGGRKVLPYATLKRCLDGWDKLKQYVVGRSQVGLDVADQGIDHNALVDREGPAMMSVDRWHGGTLGKTARRAHGFCVDRGSNYLAYDAGGLGAGIRSHMADIHEKEGSDYYLVPTNFGGMVRAKKALFSRSNTNEQMFARRGGQLAWAIRMRAEATLSLLEGENVDPEMCLLINPGIERLDEFMAELSQPEWEEDRSGRIMIVKAKPGEPSPDRYDAAVLSYESDSRNGLRQSHYGPM